MKILSVIVSATVIVVSSLTMHAKIELPSVFSDNMVVQQNAKLTVAGKAKPLSTVTFRSDWEGGECKAKADKEGRFVMKVPTPPAGGPYTIIVDDGTGEKKILQNVLSGEVWLCSGQSNMEFPVKGDWAQVMDADRVIATMQRPALRLLQIRNTTSVTPIDDASVEFGWVESSPIAFIYLSHCGIYQTLLILSCCELFVVKFKSLDLLEILIWSPCFHRCATPCGINYANRDIQ